MWNYKGNKGAGNKKPRYDWIQNLRNMGPKGFSNSNTWSNWAKKKEKKGPKDWAWQLSDTAEKDDSRWKKRIYDQMD